MNKPNKNHLYYQVYIYSQKSLLLFYVITLYYLALDCSYMTIAAISVTGTVSTLLTEIPTGIIADRWSRKKSLQIAELLKMISVIFMLAGKQTVMLYISSFIWGVADSCESGASQALLYDSFDEKENYERYLSKIYSRGYIFSAVATILATALFSYNIYSPVLISLVLIVVSFMAISCFQENGSANKAEKISVKSFNKKALVYIKGNSGLLNILLFMTLCTVIIMSVNTYTQPLLLNKGVNLKTLGFFMFIYNLLMSWGAKIYKKINIKNIHFLAAGILVGTTAIMGISNKYGTLLILGVYRIANGIIWPAATAEYNAHTESEIRATVMSYQNMLTNVSCIILEPFIGFLLDYVGINLFYVILGFIGMASFMLLYLRTLLNGRNSESKIRDTIKER